MQRSGFPIRHQERGGVLPSRLLPLDTAENSEQKTNMITGVHAMFNSPQPDELRAFLKDKLSLQSFDVGQGWLIFPMNGEVGFHPGTGANHEISLYCDDIVATVEELKARGVEFTQEIEDWGFGIGTYIAAPGGLAIQLYQPQYAEQKEA